jgi:flagellar hook assembly protein FlgD
MKETTNLTTGATQLSCVDNSGVGDAWSSIAFVKGAGNTTATTNYRHFDATTSSNTMYEYRLRQVDYDGRESFSNVVNVVVAGDNSIALADNYPNPTSGKTTISFRVPYRTNVKIEVYDMVGNLVSTLYDQEVPGSNGMYAIEWDGMDASGREVTSGTYVYKLTAGETVESKKLTVVR